MIEGVIVKPLKRISNEKGGLLEIQRKDDKEYIDFAQCYATKTFSGVIKAWYKHRLQVDQLVVISGMLQLVLYDDRLESDTFHNIMEITFGDETPKLVQIPTGIWHGFKAIGSSSTFILHINSRMYAPDDLDEERLPVNTDVIPYTWT